MRKAKAILSTLFFAAFTLALGCGGDDDENGSTDNGLGQTVNEIHVLNMDLDDDFLSTGKLSVSLIPTSNGERVDPAMIQLTARLVMSSSAVPGPPTDNATRSDDEESEGFFGLFKGDHAGVEHQTAADCANGAPVTVQPMQKVEPNASNSVHAIDIHVDSSGSMMDNDPTRIRVDAANKFVALMSQLYPGTEFAVTDFGTGETAPFTSTRLLTDFTSDPSVISAALDQVQQGQAGTPLYGSTAEVLQWLNDERPAGTSERGIVILSDGEPTDDENENTMYAMASTVGIPINTVALTQGEHNTVMRAIADQTQGIFTSASTAADLTNAFESVALGNKMGYMVYDLTIPPGAIPMDATTLCLSYGTQKTEAVPIDPMQAYF